MSISFFKKHGSTILTCVGAAGVIATAIVTAKSTPKALRKIEEAECDKGEELTKLETVKAAAPIYIPAAVLGAATITSIFAADGMNKRSKAAIIGAYSLLYTSYNKYKDKVRELYGEDANDRVIQEVVRDDYDECELEESSNDEDVLFYDFVTQQYFSSTVNEVLQKVTMEDGLECYIICTPFDIPWFHQIN